MPDILIRGMEMPPSCKCCPCYEQSLAFPDYIKQCKFGADLPQPWPLQYEKRGDNCPLLELPPHGDLISRDAVLNKIDAYVCGSQDSEFIKNEIIKAMPVVVPAERRDADA